MPQIPTVTLNDGSPFPQLGLGTYNLRGDDGIAAIVAAIESGYRLLGRRLMAATLGSDETGFEFEVEMIAVCLRNGWTLAWVPISTIYAGEPSHVRPVAHLRHFVRATRAARRLMREDA